MDQAIRKNNIGKAAGPSGINNRHVKYLAQNPIFTDLLACAFSTLLERPSMIEYIPALYKAYPVYIHDGRFMKPVCIQESILNTFHRCLRVIVRKASTLQPFQYVMDNGGRAKARKQVNQYLKGGYSITVLNIENLYSKLQHEAVLTACYNQGVPDQVLKYLQAYLGARRFESMEPITMGLADGDPLSPLLLSMTIDDTLELLS